MRRPALLLVLACAAARADGPVATLAGTIIDAGTGAPLLDATVIVSGPPLPAPRTARTDMAGRYRIDLPPGTYGVVVTFGGATAKHDAVTVAAGGATTLDDALDASGALEVTTIHERAPPPPEPAVPPQATHATATHPLPYSAAAIESDSWAVAWLLLDLDEAGRVVSFRFLKRPGRGLDEIARREAFGLRFTPARDAAGKPMASRALWKMEWPSYWRLVLFAGLATAKDAGKPPCRDRAPLNLESLHPEYRDCSPPDYRMALTEELIRSPASGPATAAVGAPALCTEPRGCYNLALGLAAAEPASAAALYQRACDGGVALACNNLGLLVQAGRGTAADGARAAALYQRACDAAEMAGCTNLGQILMNGAGVARDYPRARSALDRACTAGEAVGCHDLAILLDWGLGGPRDEARARELETRACAAGATEACGKHE